MVPQQSQIEEKHHGTNWVADRAIDFIRTNYGKHPWLLTLWWIAPHPPFNIPSSFANLYKDADLPPPTISKTKLSPLSEENRFLGDLPSHNYLKRMRELYYSSIRLVDSN